CPRLGCSSVRVNDAVSPCRDQFCATDQPSWSRLAVRSMPLTRNLRLLDTAALRSASRRSEGCAGRGFPLPPDLRAGTGQQHPDKPLVELVEQVVDVAGTE